MGKLMLGHPLSLSRCLLDCKKENRGEYLDEYLLKILESPSAKIKSQNANPPKTKKWERVGQTWQGVNGGRRRGEKGEIKESAKRLIETTD